MMQRGISKCRLTMKVLRKTWLALVLGLLICNVAPAQKLFNNSIYLTGCGHYFSGVEYNILEPLTFWATQPGISYERTVCKVIGIVCSYSQWNDFWSSDPFFSYPEFVFGSPYPPRYEAILYRTQYKMLDLALNYIFTLSKRHQIKPGLGVSRAWGIDVFPDSLQKSPSSNGIRRQNDAYWGIVPFLSYNCLILKKRVNIGTDFKCRAYSGLYSWQFDYGVHIGYNF